MPERLQIGRLPLHMLSDGFMAAMLMGFGVYIFSLVFAPGAGHIAAVVCGLLLLLMALPFAARLRVKMVADQHGLTLQGSFFRTHYEWPQITGFHRGRQGGFLQPYMHFGDGLYVDLADGTSRLLPLTMARQPYRQQRDLDQRCALLNSWVQYSRES